MKKLLILVASFLIATPALPKTAEQIPFKISESEFNCLVETLYHEARGEPPEGILAVAKVVLNRMSSKRYPSSICGVVKQQLVKGVWQFSFWKEVNLLVKPKKIEEHRKVIKIAKYAINMHYSGYDVIDNAMYYYNPEKANPGWAKSPKLKFVKQIGKHRFFKRVK